MSYGNVGLPTPRGSGTNGYVQRNLGNVRKRPQVEYTEELRERDLKAVEPRKSNPELLEHERRRKIEVECLLLEEELQERGLPEDEIEQEVAEFRKKKLEALARGDEPAAKRARPGDKETQDTHVLAKAIEEKNSKFAAALGIKTAKVSSEIV